VNTQKPIAPRWNLSSLYPDINTPEYADHVARYRSLLDEGDSLLAAAETLTSGAGEGGFDFPLWLSRYLELEDRLGETEESLSAFAYTLYSTDTTNTAYINNLSRLEEMELRSKAQDVLFLRILSRYSQELEDFYTRFPRYANYKYVMSQTLVSSYHLMSRDEENLASELERTGGNAWARLHGQIISTLQDPQSGKTFNEIRNEAYHPDRAVRKSAWEREITLLKSMEIPLAACLNNIKGATVSLNKRRGWDEAIDRSLHASRMSRKTLDALIGAIEESLPVWRSYLRAKERLLSGTDGRGIPFYDLFAPLPKKDGPAGEGPAEKKWTFTEARDYIIERFSSFSADMGDFARSAFDSRWIDGEIRKGKVGGAYCIDFPSRKESRVLSNFSGTFSDVTTLAHELGHAYHYRCIKDQPYALQHYPMTLAETASIFAEMIVMQDIISRSTGFEKIRLTEIHLQDVCQVLVDILSRYYFEHSVFQARKTSELSGGDFCRLMKEAQERAYGEGLSEERHEYLWAVKSHYYSPSLDFYNFPYAFGQLFGAALYGRYLSEGDAFADTYRDLLSQTGTGSCETVCRRAGFDIETREFWLLGINRFKNEIKQFQGP
jgi:pepF/M3 family oligoendopeptidase